MPLADAGSRRYHTVVSHPIRRALFLNPTLHLPADFVDYPWFAHHGLLFAAARVARAGWQVKLTDTFALPTSDRVADGSGWRLGAPESDLLDAIPEGPFGLVVIGSSSFLRPYLPDPRTAAFVAAVGRRFPEAAIVLADADVGGMHAVDYVGTSVIEKMGALDVVLRHSGEDFFGDPDRLVALKGSRSEVLDPPGQWDALPPFPLLDDLDAGMYGAFLWRCFRDGTWSNPFGIDAFTRPFMTSSGCPHRCVFCSSNAGWRQTGCKVQRVVPLHVLKDWAFLASRVHGARKLFILDEMANLRHDFVEMLEIFAQLDLRYEFPNGLRADRLTSEAIAMMKERISLLSVSAESASAADLAGPIGKRQDPAQVERVVAEAAGIGLPTLVHFVVGFPWETPKSVLATLDFAWRLFDTYGAAPSVQFATPLRGTPLFDICVQSGLMSPDAGTSADGTLFQHRPAFRPPAIPEGWLQTAHAMFRRKVESASSRKVIINLTYECINACEFCAVSNREKRDIPWPRLQQFIREYRAQGLDQIDLDGGEPTLHPNLVDSIRLAREIGYREINVTTNGRRLADSVWAREFLSSGVTSVLVSLHGESSGIHDAIVGVPGAFDETLAGIRNLVTLRKHGQDLGVNITVCRRNVEHLDALFELLDRERIDKVNLQLVTPFGSARQDVVPPESQATAAVCRVLDRFGKSMRLHVVNAQFCLFPGYESYLGGDVGKVGRTMIFVSEEKVNLFEYLAARRVRRPPCLVCPWAPVCDGFFKFEEDASDV